MLSLPLQEPVPGAGHKWVQRRGFCQAPVGRGLEGATGVQDEWGVAATSWLLLELQGWAEQSSTRVEGGGPIQESWSGRSRVVRLDLALGTFQFLDHLLTGIEDICGHYGHHHWKDK